MPASPPFPSPPFPRNSLGGKHLLCLYPTTERSRRMLGCPAPSTSSAASYAPGRPSAAGVADATTALPSSRRTSSCSRRAAGASAMPCKWPNARGPRTRYAYILCTTGHSTRSLMRYTVIHASHVTHSSTGWTHTTTHSTLLLIYLATQA